MRNVKVLLLSALSRETHKVSPGTVEEELPPVGGPSPFFAGDSLGDHLVGLV